MGHGQGLGQREVALIQGTPGDGALDDVRPGGGKRTDVVQRRDAAGGHHGKAAQGGQAPVDVHVDAGLHAVSVDVGEDQVAVAQARQAAHELGERDLLALAPAVDLDHAVLGGHVRDEKLADDETVDTFYNKVIENYEYGENYYIILIHSAYDVPGKASDNEEMFDASEEVYNHILCCICPVKLSEPGLSYNEATNAIEERPRDWWVQTPMTGFLFPAFNDRSSDIHGVLYFSRNPEELHSEFIDACLGAPTPISFKSQKEAFQEILTDTLGEECDYEIVRQIHENLTELAEEHKEDEIPLTLTKPEVKDLLEKSGVEPERLEHFDKVYEEAAGENTAILVPAITGTGKFAVKTPDVDIKVNPDRLDLVETKFIGGRRCLVIAVEDNVEVNGMPVKMWEEQKEVR